MKIPIAIRASPEAFRQFPNRVSSRTDVKHPRVAVSSFRAGISARFLGWLSLLLSLFAGMSVQSQTFTTIHTLTDAEGYFGSFGGGRLLQASDGNFYGNIEFGGSNAVGSVFKITPGGILTVLYSFGSVPGDGAYPTGGLVQGNDGNFYGMTGSSVFKITPSGTLTTLYTNAGWDPNTLVLGKDGSFYGTMFSAFDNSFGNNGGSGRVFKVTTDGTAAGTTFTTLYAFGIQSNGANSDGANPSRQGILVQSIDGNFYGTTEDGGPDSDGTIFKITPNGILTTLYTFAFTPHVGAVHGRNPFAGLFQASSGVFYGATEGGGPGLGTVFQLVTDGSPAGTTLTTLYSFLVDKDGGAPASRLTIDADGNLYGMTDVGGAFASTNTNDNSGTLFRLAPDGTITTLQSFGAKPGEGVPHVGVVRGSDGSFYGTTKSTVFKFDPGNGAPVPPAHGGLSKTLFKVNGSTSPTANMADTVLSFTALQSGTPAGLMVRVQFSTTPATESSWLDLANGNGSAALMKFDPSSQQFVLNSTNYPRSNGVFFRAIAAAQGYPDSISNFIGPCDLASTKPQIGSTRLDFTGNGTSADLYFRATEAAIVTGMSVRVQASTTPGNEASWSDVSNGNSVQMTQSTDPKQLLFLVNNFPTTHGVYFRAIASASGYTDSISNILGSFDITAMASPPGVTLATASPLPGSGDGHDPAHPIIVAVDNGAFAATVQSARALKTVQLQVNGETVTEYPGSADPNAVYIAYFTPIIGLHVYEAVAINDLGGRARAGTGAIYVNVVPSQSGVRADRRTGAPASAESTGKIYTVANSGGGWDDPATWMDANGNPGVPGPDDFAAIGSASVKFGLDRLVKSVSISGGHLLGPGNLEIKGILTFTAGTIEGYVGIFIDPGAVLQFNNPTDIQFNPSNGLRGHIYNGGVCNIHGSAGVTGADYITNNGTINWLPPLQIALNAGTVPAASLRILQSNSITGGGLITGTLTALIANDGSTLVSAGGGNLVSAGGGNLVSAGGGNLVSAGGGNLVSAGGGNLVSAGGGNLVSAGGGNIVSAGGGNFQTTTGEIRPASAATAAASPSGYTQNGGETNLSACTIVGSFTLNGGTLSGTGFIQGILTNNGGYISPGHSPGVIAVIGSFAQNLNGTLVVERGGPSPGQFDQLQVSGVANLSGKLDIKTINGYTPDPADTFSPLGFGSVTGTFASVSSNAQVTVTSTGLLTSIDPTKPNPTTGQPLNIATRLQVQGGDNVLVAGFIITGPAGVTKKVLIRGIGPSLANFGVAGTIADPLLELHKADGTVVTNDNWQQASNAAQIPAGFAPSSNLESAIYIDLGPGNYTAILKGAHNETGVALAEVYDFETTSAVKLANIATRGFVNTGDNVMIGGFIIGGTEPANVLVRAIGPSLTQFGVQGALQATTLELHDSNGSVISNEGWRNSQESAIQATTIAPSNDNEAAILATLVPGNYTAVVRGKNNTTGIAVVEAYNLQ